MAELVINLPDINGDLEAGIAVGADPSLADAVKMKIAVQNNVVMDYRAVLNNAVVKAYREHANLNNAARALVVNGVAAVITCNLVRHTVRGANRVPDGDWVLDQSIAVNDADEAAYMRNNVTRESIVRALTVVIATKANWWNMNHHTGQGTAQGYVKKVLEVQYPGAVDANLVTAAHTIGHYASTRHVLSIAGIEGIIPTEPSLVGVHGGVKLAADAALRFSGYPAGTHRMAVAFEAGKRVVMSAYAPIFPRLDDITAIPGHLTRIKENRAAHHVGAFYLTGHDRAEYADNVADSFLGRLGTFINTMFSKSTLAKSPHLDKARVQTYEDYSPDYQETLNAILTTANRSREEALRELDVDVRQNTANIIENAKKAFRFEV